MFSSVLFLCCCLVSYFFRYLTQANDRLRIRPVYNTLEVIRTVLDASQCSVIDISRQEIVMRGRDHLIF